METIITAIVALIAGIACTYFAMAAIAARLKRECNCKEESLAKIKEEFNSISIEKARAEERLLLQESIMEQERKNSALMMEQLKEQSNTALENIKSQLAKITEENLKQRSEELKNTNIEQLSHILSPIREQMKKMEESVKDANTNSAAHKASIEKSIENLAMQAIKVGEHADDLAKALKNNGKVQGDWGEQLLESILEGSGLRKDHEYSIQENIKDGKRDIRPDVIINCPGNKKIIIDSKVSLTAYIDYLSAETKEEAEKCAKNNRESIKRHIDELSAKEYAKTVGNSITHVLMFIPNEGSYILALRTDPQIAQYAYKKGVLMINPTNLMISLQLIYNIWQSERQAKNIEKVIKESELLYEKFVGFCDTWSKLRESLNGAMALYDKADKQLYEGNGNIVKKLENLKSLGIIPKKNIPEKMLERS